jgi:long-chain acyl-CoA synthetase
MRLMVSGGAAIRPEIVSFFNSFGIDFVQGYGLSETSPVLCVNPIEKNKHESVGPAVGNCEIRIDNSESTSEDGHSQNNEGEIIAHGESVFKQYFKNPDATSATFTADGWFRTGDLGQIDEDGYLFITGRAKNLIVSPGGKNIHPEALEEMINQSEFVIESLVVGKTSGCGTGEEPFAIIVPDIDALDNEIGSSFSDSEIRKFFGKIIEDINRKVAAYKRIKGFKLQYEEFPKTSTRKIKRYLYNFDD